MKTAAATMKGFEVMRIAPVQIASAAQMAGAERGS
jgi:hypothetical protein